MNAEKNQRVLFADRVILVEGISDRIFFTRAIERWISIHNIVPNEITEIVDIGGKGFFSNTLPYWIVSA